MKRIGYIALAAAAILVPLVAIAEAPHREADRDFGSRGRLLLVLRMADELGLSDEKALAVSRALKEAESKRDEIHTKRRELEKQIRQALAQKKPDDAALGKLIDQAVDLDRQRAKAMEDSFTSLKKILTVQEQAKLVLMRMEMHHEPGPHGPGGWHGGGWHHGPDGPEGDHGPGGHGPPPPPPGGEEGAG
jgi:uncharacterized membrane protein